MADKDKPTQASRLLTAVQAVPTPARPKVRPPPGAAKAARSLIVGPNPNNALRQHVLKTKATAAPDRLSAPPSVSPRLAPPSPGPSPQIRAIAAEAQRRGRTFVETRTGREPATPVDIALPRIDSPTALGRLIRARRAQMGLTQRALAAHAGVGRRFVSELEGGKATLELGKALQITRVLGLTLFANAADEG